MPAGYSVEREEIGRTAMPQTFNITMPGAPTPLASVDTEEEAQQKLEKLTEIRQQEREKSLNQIEEINGNVQKMKDKLEHLIERQHRLKHRVTNAETRKQLRSVAKEIRDLTTKMRKEENK